MDVERRHGNFLAFTLLSTEDFWTMFRHSFAVYSSSKQYAKSCYPLLGWLVSYFLTILHAASFFWHCSLQSGKFKPVIKKAMVELDGKNTSIAVTDCYVWFVPFIFFKKNDLLWHQFQVHLSRSLHQCEMSGPSRTDTSALVRRYEIARDDHMLVQGPIQFKLIYLLTFLTTLTGPIQFSGPGSDDSNHTLMLELGAQA